MANASQILKMVMDGEADFILAHNFKVRKALPKGANAMAYKAVLFKFDDVERCFKAVCGVHYKVFNNLTAAGMLRERPFDNYGLYTCYEFVSVPRLDEHISKHGDCFDVDRQPISATVDAIQEIAHGLGFAVETIPSIKAFKLVKLESNKSKREFSDPFIHGVYKVSDLDIAGWKVAIIDTLSREGFYRGRKRKQKENPIKNAPAQNAQQ